MPFLCQKHRAEISRNHSGAMHLWQQLIDQGAQAHQQQDFNKAFRLFGSAGEIASLLIESGFKQPEPGHISPVTMLVTATHNSASSLCAQRQLDNAERVLSQLHGQIMALSLNPEATRAHRLDAVASLETTLFSLASLLGNCSRTETLHSLIEETERVAEQAAIELFH